MEGKSWRCAQLVIISNKNMVSIIWTVESMQVHLPLRYVLKKNYLPNLYSYSCTEMSDCAIQNLGLKLNVYENLTSKSISFDELKIYFISLLDYLWKIARY